jgi:hypothetical protein
MGLSVSLSQTTSSRRIRFSGSWPLNHKLKRIWLTLFHDGLKRFVNGSRDHLRGGKVVGIRIYNRKLSGICQVKKWIFLSFYIRQELTEPLKF